MKFEICLVRNLIKFLYILISSFDPEDREQILMRKLFLYNYSYILVEEKKVPIFGKMVYNGRKSTHTLFTYVRGKGPSETLIPWLLNAYDEFDRLRGIIKIIENEILSQLLLIFLIKILKVKLT